MRRIGFVLTVVCSTALPVAAQTLAPLAQTAPVPATYGPKTVVPALIACTDTPVSAASASSLRIIAPHAGDLHKASVRGELVVINGGTPHGLAIGQRYFARRLQPPADGQPLSVTSPGSLRTSGWLTVVAADEQSALGRVDYACSTIEADDYLEPYAEPALPKVDAADGRPDFSNLARVLFGSNRRELFGSGDFLSINRGATQGMTMGTRVAFYRDRRDGTPLVEMGTGIVLEVLPDTAKVVVERAQEIKAGDYVAVRARP
jgi:hypothetical protein